MTKSETYRPPSCKCPTCDERLDAATSVQEAKFPEPGDLSVCFHCGALLEFDAKLVLIALRPEIFEALDIRTVATLQLAQSIVFMRRTPEA